MAAKTRKPNKSFTDLTQAGEKAHLLALKYRAEVEPRLDPGVIDGLRADLDGLAGEVSNTKAAKSSAKASTAAQDTRLADAHSVLSAIRNAVRKGTNAADVRRAYGLGTKLNAGVVSSVLASGKVAIARARKEPTEARALGILDADLNELEALLAAADAADKSQEKTLAASPATTAQRNAMAQRVADAVTSISAKGVLAFARNEQVREQFDALDDGPSGKRLAPAPK